MHIDKYLCDLEAPFHKPGPFSARLKYELKQAFFDRRTGNAVHYAYSSAIFSLLIVCTLLVFKPYTAQRINSFVFGGQDNTLDMLLLTENDIDISNFPSNVRAVSHDLNSAFPFLEEDKPYLLHKFRNHENQMLIYISEVRPRQSRTLY